VPALLVHTIILFRTKSLWTEKVTVYSHHGMLARDVPQAQPIVLMIGACAALYWLSFIPREYLFALMPRRFGMRTPGDGEKGCILTLLRMVTLLGLYGGAFFL
jgi:hypothetical protein